MDRVQAACRVFVTGATGFVGRAVIQALRADGYVVRCLVRRGSESHLRGLEAIERVEGDVLARRGLDDDIAGCDSVIHLVGIIREHPASSTTFQRVHVEGTRNVLAAAVAAGVRRYVHMSALGSRAEARSQYHRTKWAAEELVRASALPWTIFRPSVIYGRGDGFVSLLAGMVRRLPIVPVIGDGRQRVQPVPVEQVAEAFVKTLALPATVKQTFDVGGPDPVSMVELIELLGRLLGKRRVLRAHLPIGLVRPVARLLSGVPSFPLTPDQLLMLEEDNTCDPQPFVATFGLTPVPLAAGLTKMFG